MQEKDIGIDVGSKARELFILYLTINAAQAGAHQITAELTAKNRSIVMRVADDAGGIPDDILPHIFQPGFSTKFDEQTGVPSPGLGLCHVRDIVNKWNAQISVESRVPEGTTFRVDIPSLLVVEQNANKALKVADRGYVLETGKIVLSDTAENLRGNDVVQNAYLGA